MGRVFQPLLFLLARCTRNQLIRQIEFLKAENQMLAETAAFKRHIVLQARREEASARSWPWPLGTALEHMISIV